MTTISRRVLIGRIGAVVGAAALTPRSATAQGAQAVAPAPPFDTHRDYRLNAEPVSYPDPDIITADSCLQRASREQHGDSSSVDRRDVVRRAGVVQPGKVSRLERRADGRPASMD
jgi:hypothetical protein